MADPVTEDPRWETLEEAEVVRDIVRHLALGDVGCGCTGSYETSVVTKFGRLIQQLDSETFARAALSSHTSETVAE